MSPTIWTDSGDPNPAKMDWFRWWEDGAWPSRATDLSNKRRRVSFTRCSGDHREIGERPVGVFWSFSRRWCAKRRSWYLLLFCRQLSLNRARAETNKKLTLSHNALIPCKQERGDWIFCVSFIRNLYIFIYNKESIWSHETCSINP